MAKKDFNMDNCWICRRSKEDMIKEGFEKEDAEIIEFDSACYVLPLCDACQDIIGKIAFDTSNSRINDAFQKIGKRIKKIWY